MGEEDIEPRLRRLNTFSQEERVFVRRLYMWADEVTMDSQGRVALPRQLAEFAGLAPGGKGLVIGALDRLEVWNPETFERHLNAQDEAYEDLAERIMTSPLA